MDYEEYIKHRAQLLADGQVKIDAGDLSLYDKFPRVDTIFEDETGGHIGENIHRCHLVEDFLRVNHLTKRVEKRYVSFSEGVRHSLSVLMELWNDKQWLIAGDNYPFYTQEADRQGLSYDTFQTLEDGASKTYFLSGDVLLLTYPFKPSGEEYTRLDWFTLTSWLKQDRKRRIIFDTVYVLDWAYHQELFDLYQVSHQVVLLHSLSKSFAAPKVAGFTFSFDEDVRKAFTQLGKDAKKMRLCYLLLNKNEGLARKHDVIDFIQKQHDKAVRYGLIDEDTAPDSYLFYRSMVSTEGLLTVPPTVYNSEAQGTIISTLGL